MSSQKSIVVNNLNEAPAALAAVTHTGIDDLANDQVTLVARVFDKTGSMYKFKAEVEQADRELIADLKPSKAADEILMSTWLFDTGFVVLHGFVGLDDVTPLTGVYHPEGETAVYDAVYSLLTDPNAGVVAYEESLRSKGIRVKVVVDVFTDGEDNRSSIKPAEIKKLVDDLVKQENYYFNLYAFGDKVAQSVGAAMGFPNVLTLQSTPGEVRRATGTESKSIIRASQTTIASNNFFA